MRRLLVAMSPVAGTLRGLLGHVVCARCEHTLRTCACAWLHTAAARRGGGGDEARERAQALHVKGVPVAHRTRARHLQPATRLQWERHPVCHPFAGGPAEAIWLQQPVGRHAMVTRRSDSFRSHSEADTPTHRTRAQHLFSFRKSRAKLAWIFSMCS